MSSLTMSRPYVSSPLADSSRNGASSQRVLPQRNSSFPSSRAIRPFPTISTAFQPQSTNKKPVKLIVPPTYQQGTFVLDLTQAEFSRHD